MALKVRVRVSLDTLIYLSPPCDHGEKKAKTLAQLLTKGSLTWYMVTWVCSSIGRALALQARCREFDSLQIHRLLMMVVGLKAATIRVYERKIVTNWYNSPLSRALGEC